MNPATDDAAFELLRATTALEMADGAVWLDMRSIPDLLTRWAKPPMHAPVKAVVADVIP